MEETTRHRRAAPRWRRILVRLAVLTLFWLATGVGAAEAYVESVPLPGIPPQPQASVLYFRDARTPISGSRRTG